MRVAYDLLGGRGAASREMQMLEDCRNSLRGKMESRGEGRRMNGGGGRGRI